MDVADNNKPPPIVSIGMFIYNGGAHIRAAIESMLNQSFRDFELLISDNASTDNTEAICREYATRDNRIRYVRQPVNLGAEANCLFVLDQTVGEFFMWAAHDDIKSADFLEHNLNFLKQHPDYVASTSPVRFEDRQPNTIDMGDQSLDQENVEERFLACLGSWRGNGRFYSLMRRKAVIDCKILRKKSYIGLDIAFVLELAGKGKLKRIDLGFVTLGRHGLSGSGAIYKAYRTNIFNWIFPLHEFSAEIWRLAKPFSLQGKVKIAAIIFKMNLISFLHQIKTEAKRFGS